MDPTRFDALTRLLAGPASRRRVVAAALAALGLSRLEGRVEAGPSCKNVGKPCDKDKDCCSGVCKGKKDKKKCKAHDKGGCGKNNGPCGGRDCTTSAGQEGECFTTTGKAGYCASDGECFFCKEDKDCRPFCGPKAACVLCTECEETQNRACVGVAECNFPPS